MRTTYQTTEYGSFIAGKTVDGYVTLPAHTFETLESFILANCGSGDDAPDLMGLSVRKGIGKVITAKNYVGVITMNDGTTIEVLPKINSKVPQSPAMVKRLLIDMLKTLRDSPYKSIQSTNVDVEKMTLFEIFIRMFVDEVFSIVKRGLKCGYVSIEENTPVFKGKLLVSSHIRHNFAHKERSYVTYDDFNTNRAENRLLKATLLYLYKQTGSARNKADIRTLLNAFAEVPTSGDYPEDFAKVSSDRNMADYHTSLLWSKVFLMGKSFTSFAGSEVAFALLFPMETLFESYVADQMRRVLDARSMKLSAQDKTFHLFDFPSRKFQMRPDLVVTRRFDKAVFICDTKWKLLDASRTNFGISQPDMYQMYAYQKKYAAKSVTLIYPLCSNLNDRNSPDYSSKDGVTVKVRYVDLFNIRDSLLHIVADFNAKY